MLGGEKKQETENEKRRKKKKKKEEGRRDINLGWSRQTLRIAIKYAAGVPPYQKKGREHFNGHTQEPFGSWKVFFPFIFSLFFQNYVVCM
jgi:hypothetical protein